MKRRINEEGEKRALSFKNMGIQRKKFLQLEGGTTATREPLQPTFNYDTFQKKTRRINLISKKGEILKSFVKSRPINNAAS